MNLDFISNNARFSMADLIFKNKTLEEILNKYPEAIEELCVDYERLDDDSIMIGGEMWVRVPRNIDDAIYSIMELFSAGEYRLLDEGEDKDDYEEEIVYVFEDYPLVKEIFDNKEMILEDMEFLKVVNSDITFGGEDDRVFKRKMYDSDTLTAILETMAELNDCKSSEVSDDMFESAVGEYGMKAVKSFVFNKETGEDSCTEECMLNK